MNQPKTDRVNVVLNHGVGLKSEAFYLVVPRFFSDKGVTVESIEISMKGDQSTGMALLEVANARSYDNALKLDKYTRQGSIRRTYVAACVRTRLIKLEVSVLGCINETIPSGHWYFIVIRSELNEICLFMHSKF